MGLLPDGKSQHESGAPAREIDSAKARRSTVADVAWTRSEALCTPAFWLIVITFGVAHVGVSGLNLHVFSFVSDQGHPTMVAALVMSTIAFMQFSTPIVWGLLAERSDIGRLIMAKFLIQAAGISLALSLPGLFLFTPVFFYMASAWAEPQSWRK
jgi:hypothetical protein